MSEVVWHAETITASTEKTLRDLRQRSLLGEAYLAGGAALALRFGHRRSLDLDFAFASKAPHTVHATIGVTKVSFLGYSYPVLFSPAPFLGVPVADPRDVACMKISAVASRGTRRDFVDLYCASKTSGLSDILGWFGRKYARARYSRVHVLKSLTFFQDAELDPMPDIAGRARLERIEEVLSAGSFSGGIDSAL